MMTERAGAAETGSEGGIIPRVLTDRWKGLTPEQLSAIRREREAQCLERQVTHLMPFTPYTHTHTRIYT